MGARIQATSIPSHDLLPQGPLPEGRSRHHRMLLLKVLGPWKPFEAPWVTE